MGVFDWAGDLISGAGDVLGNVWDAVEGSFDTGGSETTTRQYDTMTPQQKALLNTLLGQVSQSFEKDISQYPGEAYPDVQAEQTYLNMFQSPYWQNLLSGGLPYEVGPEWAENYWEQAVKPAYEKIFKEETLPQLTESFSGPGFWSSNRANQTQEAISDYGTELARAKAELMYNEEQAKRSAYDTYAGMMPNLANVTGEAAGYARTLQQAKVQDEINRWVGSNPALNVNAQLALSLLGFQPYTYGTNTVTESPGIFASLLGGGAQGAGAALTNWALA